MGRIAGIAARVRAAVARRDAERRMEEEFRFHLEMETEKNVRAGMAPGEARRRALAAFGSVERHRDEMRDTLRDATYDAPYEAPRGRWRESLVADVRFAWRTLRRGPGLVIAATVILAFGIGLNGLVFGIVNGLLLRPLPAADAGRLVALYRTDPQGDGTTPLGYLDYVEWRDRSGIFDGLAAFDDVPLSVETGSGAGAEMVWGEAVTSNYFSVLAMRPALGRFFGPADSVPGASPVAVVSHESWRLRFGGDPEIVGRAIRINGSRFTIVGVAPPGFHGMRTFGFWPEVWAPLAMHDVLVPGSTRMLQGRGDGWAVTFGRLRPGWSRARAEGAAALFARQLAQAYPADNRDAGAVVLPARSGFENPQFVPPRMLLLSSSLALFAVVLVLLVVCANLANLLLARVATRQRELAIRLSLGCSRARLLRQLLVEASVLAAPGALLGVALVFAGPALQQLMMPRLQFRVGIPAGADHRVVLFTAAVALLTVLLFGLAPALRASRPSLVPSLKSAIGEARPRGRVGMRGALVVAQLALSVVLLTGGMLFVRSLLAARAVDVGFDPRGRVTLSVNPGLQGYDEARGRALYRDVLARVEALPGVVVAGWGFPIPFDTYGRGLTLFVDGVARSGERPGVEVSGSVVDVGFFAALGVPIVAGRGFAVGDSAGALGALVVSRALAARLWPGRDPVGRRVRLWSADGAELTVVGVAGDAKFASLSDAMPVHAYVPLRQNHRGWQSLVVHTRAEPEATLRQVRQAVAAVDPALATFGAMSMGQAMSNALNGPQSAASVAGAFGLAALLVAAVGLYALVAHLVAERTREIGVRVALGATPAGVQRLVLGRAGKLGLAGLAIGLGGGLAVARLMRGLLIGLSPHDPATFALVPLLLGAVVLAASWVPARRATRLDPSAALRE
jgi:predicted permease